MKNMKRMNVMMVIVVITALFCGCEEEQQAKTGFLSDYSRLQVVSDDSLRYVPQSKLKQYSKFIIDPVFFIGRKAMVNSTTRTRE